MKTRIHILLIALSLLIAGLLISGGTARAVVGSKPVWGTEPIPTDCTLDDLGPQEALICIPSGWSAGDALLIYTHGYAQPSELVYPWNMNPAEVDTMVGAVAGLLAQGYAFAAPSYSKTGYVMGGVEADITGLLTYYETTYGAPGNVLIGGASEGGIVTVMMLEQHPELFVGGLAMCGPLGGMAYQVEYLGDFYIGFDYLFPYVFSYPPSSTSFGLDDPPIPPDAYQYWGLYTKRIEKAIVTDFETNHGKYTRALFRHAGAAYDGDPMDPYSYVAVAEEILRFSIFGADDLLATTGGQPYDNADIVAQFSGYALEAVTADSSAATFVDTYYTPNGNLTLPLETLHTTGDGAVPVIHASIYEDVVATAGHSGELNTVLVDRAGHCNFTEEEIIARLTQLVFRACGFFGC